MVKIMSRSGTIYIVIGIILFIPIFIGSKMLLPFPYGFTLGIGGAIVILAIFLAIGIKKNKKPFRQFQQKIVCKKCNVENLSYNKFCTKCGESLV